MTDTTEAGTTTRFITRADIGVRPSCESPDRWVVSWGEGSGRSTVEVASSVAAVLATLPVEGSMSELVGAFRLCFPEAQAEQLCRHFLEEGLFATDGDVGVLRPAEARWLALNWNDALVFHRATRGMLWRHEYPADAQVMTWTDFDRPVPASRARPEQQFDDLDDTIGLSPARDEWLAEDVASVLRRRRTKRAFKGSTLTEPELSTLLHNAFRPIIAGVSRDYYTTLSSADGYREKKVLHPLTAFVVFGRRDIILGQSGSVYRYNPMTHSLQEVKGGSLPDYFKFSNLLWGQEFADDAPVGMVLCLNWDQFMWKYRTSHAYRFAHYDVGAYMQTAQLVATAIGLDTFITPALDDIKVSRLLEVDEGTCAPTYFLALGRSRRKASRDPIPDVPEVADT